MAPTIDPGKKRIVLYRLPQGWMAWQPDDPGWCWRSSGKADDVQAICYIIDGEPAMPSAGSEPTIRFGTPLETLRGRA